MHVDCVQTGRAARMQDAGCLTGDEAWRALLLKPQNVWGGASVLVHTVA